MKFYPLVFLFGIILLTATNAMAQAQDSTANEAGQKPYTADRLRAMPIGGPTAFYKYLVKNLKYPKKARKEKVEGTVTVSFIIGEDGFVKKESVEVVKSLHPLCDAEAIRVMQESPKWSPATHQGKPVGQKLSVPINFKL